MAIKLVRSSPSDSADEDESSDIMAEINITPLVDVFLVLLIIFMVTSSVMSQMGVTVSLPKAGQASSDTDPKGVVVTLLANGGVQLNGRLVSKETLNEGFTAAFSKTSSRLVVLEGDRKAFLGSAIQIMDTAKAAGATTFAIATGGNTESE